MKNKNIYLRKSEIFFFKYWRMDYNENNWNNWKEKKNSKTDCDYGKKTTK